MAGQRVIIIGAGIGGLATANLLAKAGYQVAVYEQHDTAGGRAGLLRAKGFQFDTGPSWYLMPEVFDHYFALLGQRSDQLLRLQKLTPAYKAFYEQAPAITITGDQTTDEASFEAVETGAGRALRRYVDRGNAIYRLALDHFLYSNFTSPTDLLRAPVMRRAGQMVRLALTPIDRYVRGYVRDLRLRQILEYPMVFLGASPFAAPALYSLMSALDFREGVFYPQGGLYEIIRQLERLGRELGVDYHYAQTVTKITSHAGRATGIELADGQQLAADIVISNADLHFTETKLLAAKDRSYPDRYWRKRQAGPSALLLYLGVKGRLPELEHHNLLFAKAWRANFAAIYDQPAYPSPASIYLCKPSATDPGVAPKGHENLFVLVPLPAGKIPDQEQQAQLVDQYLAQVADMIGVADLTQRLVFQQVFGPADFAGRFNAWQATALGPSHLLSQSAFLRTGNQSRRLKQLYYVGGSTVPGIGLPMCLIGAELIYKRLAGERRGGRVDQIRRLTGDDNA